MRSTTFCLIGLLAVLMARSSSFAAGSVPPPEKTQEYTACGCGCCSGLEPRDQCLYKAKGDSLEKVIEADKKTASDASLCATVGSSIPSRYHYCD